MVPAGRVSSLKIRSRLTAPIAKAGISILAFARFDTDYLLVRAPDLDRALAALRAAGHQIGDRGTGRRLSALPIPYPLAPIPSVQGACTTYAPTSMTEAAM